MCGQCTRDGQTKLAFDTIHDVDNLVEQMNGGKIHLAKEVTVITVASFGHSTFRAIPIFALGSCKAANEGQQASIFKKVN